MYKIYHINITKNLFIPIFFIFLISITFVLFNSLNKILEKDLEKKDFSITSVAPVNIQVITRLNNSTFINYVQKIYIKPKEENKLIILIKPNIWLFLKQKEKDSILLEFSNVWKNIYKQEYPNSLKKPAVFFSNSI